jgi:hypothetical protein
MSTASVELLTRDVEMIAVKALKEHPENPNRGNVDVIEQSVQHNGFYGALVVQRSTGYILSGNHRWQAAKRLKMKTVPVIYVDVDDDKALRILLADNRTSELSHRDPAALLTLLEQLNASVDGLQGIGYHVDDIEELRSQMSDEDRDAPRENQLLDMLDVTVREPKHLCHRNEAYMLGDRITLLVRNPFTDMQHITPFLGPDTLFLPYAGGFIGFIETTVPCVVAQPNTYIASYIIDRYKEAFGENQVRQIQ